MSNLPAERAFILTPFRLLFSQQVCGAVPTFSRSGTLTIAVIYNGSVAKVPAKARRANGGRVASLIAEAKDMRIAALLLAFFIVAVSMVGIVATDSAMTLSRNVLRDAHDPAC